MRKAIFFVAIFFSVFAALRLEEIIGVGYPIFRYYDNFAHHALDAKNIYVFVVHIPAGIITLLSGALAISIAPGSNWHSRVGAVYVIASLICAVCALIITIGYHVTPLIVSAYGAGSAVWIYFTLKLVSAAARKPRGDVSYYAIMSYSFALLFVTARLSLFVAFLFGDRAWYNTFPLVYGSILWGLFWCHLAAGEYIVWRLRNRSGVTDQR